MCPEAHLILLQNHVRCFLSLESSLQTMTDLRSGSSPNIKDSMSYINSAPNTSSLPNDHKHIICVDFGLCGHGHMAHANMCANALAWF